jgi:ribosomal protein S24E
MSIIETVTDEKNTFLSRRELTCNFTGLGGKLKSIEATDMVTKKFKLDDKIVIPMRLKTHVGKSLITGIFYVYDDEGLAKKHVNPTIFSRLEKTKAKLVEVAAKESEVKEPEVAAKEKSSTEDVKEEKAE